MVDQGLQWRKVDFHVHTPASREDWRGPAAYAPDDLVADALSIGLDAIAVTDHNTGVWIDEVIRAAKGTGLTVFPGVEVTAPGGKRNIHILALFDPSQRANHIHEFLATIGILEKDRGAVTALANSTIEEVLQRIADHGGVPILAHADHTSGVINDMQGQQRTRIIQHPALLGVEITIDNTARFLDGTDPTYRRSLACTKGSDSHRPEELGSRVTFMKLGAPTLAAVRQCLHDPETRVRLTPPVAAPLPRLRGIEVRGGFFDGIAPNFNDGLNAILGGKGVGKSLLVEFIRFALDQPSDVDSIKSDMQGKLASKLGRGGSITVEVCLPSGRRYSVDRRFDGVTDPIKAIEVDSGAPYTGDVAKLFPILAYSQNEIIEITRDPSIQRKLIDRLVDTDAAEQSIKRTTAALERNSEAYIGAVLARERAMTHKSEIDTRQAQIDDLNARLADPRFGEQQAWDRRKMLLDQLEANLNSALDDAKALGESLAARSPADLTPEDQTDPDLASVHTVTSDALGRFRKTLDAAASDLSVGSQGSVSARARFDARYETWHSGFEAFLQTIGDQEALVRRRAVLEQEQIREAAMLAEQEALAARFDEHRDERERLLDELAQAQRARFKARADVYQRLTTMSGGQLQLEILEQAAADAFLQGLHDLTQRLRVQSRNLERLAAQMTPRAFAQMVLNRDLETIAREGALTPETAQRIIESVLSDEERLRTLLRLPFERLLQDVPQIRYRKQDGNYYPLDQLSVGQKCTALLLIALTEGTMPILVDQPEDALDVSTVYTDVVQRLRAGKERRQFIVTTHNSNVAVSSDSDMFLVLTGTATQGEILCVGAIDVDDIAREVMQQLEGGEGSYRMRGKKYHLP